MIFTKHKNKKNSYLKKIFMSLLAITITLTILLTSFLTFTFLKTTVSLTTKFNNNLLSQTNYSITYINDMVKRLSLSLINDANVINFMNMSSPDYLSSIRASKVLSNQILTLGNIDSIYLYNATLDLFYSSKSGEQSKNSIFSDKNISTLLSDKEFYESYNGQPIPLNINPKNNTAKTITYIFFDKNQNSSGQRNAIIINVKSSALTDSIKSMNQFNNGINMAIYVIDENGIIISATNNDLIPDVLKTHYKTDNFYSKTTTNEINPFNSKTKFLKFEGISYLLTQTNNNSNNWHILSYVPVKIIFREVIYSSIVGAIFAICIFLAFSTLCMLFAKRLNKPIKNITELIKGQKLDSVSTDSLATDEFQFVLYKSRVFILYSYFFVMMSLIG